ncbi:hypothetical protein [Paraburkholderia xenovorans]
MAPESWQIQADRMPIPCDGAAYPIRIYAMMAGVVKVRAASGIDHFDTLPDDIRMYTSAQHSRYDRVAGRIAVVLAGDLFNSAG